MTECLMKRDPFLARQNLPCWTLVVCLIHNKHSLNTGGGGGSRVLLTEGGGWVGGGSKGGGGGGGPPCVTFRRGCCSFTGPWTVTRSSLRMLRRVAAFCRPLRPVLLLVSFPRSRSPVVGTPSPPPQETLSC